MKERRWIAAFAAEGVLCAGLTLLLNGSAAADAGLMAFPFAQIGAGLRALSLMGGVRNVLAIMLYAAVSLLPAGFLAAVCRKRKLVGEDGLLLLMSVTLFGTLWAAVNPAWLAQRWFAGKTLGLPMLGGLLYAEVIAYAILRLLRTAGAANARALRRYVRWVLAAIATVLVYAAFGSSLRELLASLTQLREGNSANMPQIWNTGAGPSLLWTQAMLAIRYLIDAASALLGVGVILEALRLLAAQDGGDPVQASECASRIAERSAQTLRFTLLAGLAVNLAQVLLARQLRSIALNVSLPLSTVALCLAALLLARLMQENRKLREDNDLFI